MGEQARIRTFVWASVAVCTASLPACGLFRGGFAEPPQMPPPARPAFRNPPAPADHLHPPPRPEAASASLPMAVSPVSRKPPPRIQVREIEPTPPKPPPEVAVPVAGEDPLLEALRAFLDRHPDMAVMHLEKLDKVNQEALLYLLPVIVRLAEADLRTNPESVAVLLEQMQQAGELLRPLAALKTGKVCFCREVTEYGKFVPIDKNHSFRPGEHAELYVELQNFQNQAGDSTGDARRFYNQFRGELVLRDGAGSEVWRKEWFYSAYSWTPRLDRHLVLGFEVPRSLEAGRYSMDVTVEDRPTRRKADRQLDFWVSGLGGR